MVYNILRGYLGSGDLTGGARGATAPPAKIFEGRQDHLGGAKKLYRPIYFSFQQTYNFILSSGVQRREAWEPGPPISPNLYPQKGHFRRFRALKIQNFLAFGPNHVGAEG